ncbi:hypothetical protein A2467_01525 [Candidatus Nomurabacteria bacterium RIFOXYC2_FULL_36_8]|nr:MAG: hypothetical protein UR97_C0003G0013 [Candidatus Nomurabacteria bacterium GW2011_GWE2_36_115]KKP94119.1 MAG: hypothetical protein US00_C0003G0043 [Candidatus Nomurabacteria bacterium GW2011_GWF2_36_126]KKP96753.1 MAG: hypothetical protein US04_C0001G0255 [Candidatus Nomurabacteria bacterium GW2011_GWD2_36_14]KKP99643.1 MAG: hypothetical protein US08_C0001G0326 [Candidatus Nomurabacteria bacterium GW2011_GWF2_36_19]KKQ05441.1 MAG: hypothetical protein US17_C0004G0013 [Candidatus Nomuraba
MCMKGPEFKINKPEIPPQTTPPELINDINKISSGEPIPENAITPEKKKNIKDDPFMMWMARKGLKGETYFSHTNFIEDVIEDNKKNQNKKEIEQALVFALNLPDSRPDLVASLYILEGNEENEEKALDLILGYTDRSLDYVMKNTLILLLKNKSKEDKEKIMEMIKKYNPDFNNYIENRYSKVE